MPINPIVMKKIKENHNIITTKQVMELGFSKALLPKYVREGLMERVRQGVYILAGKSHDDMYLKFCSRNGASRIMMGVAPFFLCGDMDYILDQRINISEFVSYLPGNGISCLSLCRMRMRIRL